MLYFKALLDGLAAMPPADPDLRAQIEKDAPEHGWPYVHQQLAAVDPVSAAEIHPNRSQRLRRALAVYRASSRTTTELRQAQQQNAAPACPELLRLVQLADLARARSV